MSAFDTQVAGNHYKDLVIQPAEYIHRNDIGYMEGCVIKYVSRWRKKGGIRDLDKAKHYIDLLIEMEREYGDAPHVDEDAPLASLDKLIAAQPNRKADLAALHAKLDQWV